MCWPEDGWGIKYEHRKTRKQNAAALMRHDKPMTLYFHCMVHCFNLCASQSVNVASVRTVLMLFEYSNSMFENIWSDY